MNNDVFKDLTNGTSNELNSHRDPRVPGLRVNADMWSHDGSGESVCHYRVTVTVSLENLLNRNINIFKFSTA